MSQQLVDHYFSNFKAAKIENLFSETVEHFGIIKPLLILCHENKKNNPDPIDFGSIFIGQL
jgi:hypothetical protein